MGGWQSCQYAGAFGVDVMSLNVFYTLWGAVNPHYVNAIGIWDVYLDVQQVPMHVSLCWLYRDGAKLCEAS
jgi:hypothetical protein